MNSGRIDIGSWLSATAATAIPLSLGLYWPLYLAGGAEATSMVIRILIIGTVGALVLVWFDAPSMRAEIHLSAMLGVFLILLIVPSLTATDPARAFRNLVKLALMCLIALGLVRALRDYRTSRNFGYAMLAGSAVLSAFVLYLYVEHVGLSVASFAQLRQMKGMLSGKEDLSLNSIGFSAIFMYVIGVCLVRPVRWIWWLGGFVFGITAFLAGSRAPGLIVAVSAIVLLILHLARSPSINLRVVGWSIAVTLALLAAASVTSAPTREIMSLTEGRSVLWKLAWDKFTERPLVGYGLESWRDDISLIPEEFSVRYGTNQIAGAYHSEYATLLAEGGLVAFLPALAIVVWLLRCSLWAAFRSSVPAVNGYMILFGCLLLLLHAVVEVPGLFGYAQDPADYLAYIFLAVVISRLSVYEDNRRIAARLRPSALHSAIRQQVFREI
jgi:O-antigen ligase